MSNYKHGFYSKSQSVNPDCRLISSADLSGDDLCLAEAYLSGEQVSNPIHAHNVIKAVYQSGRFKFPTIWAKAETYCTKNYEFEAMEKLARS